MSRGVKIIKNCLNCNNEFQALKYKSDKGKAKFCSKNCYNKNRNDNKKDKKYLNKIHQLKYKYGLTEENYLSIIKSQDNKCSICKISFTEVNHFVDHCHNNGQVRGLLCNSCNLGLGMFKDNITNLKEAIKYLEINI